MKITIEINEKEYTFLRQFCIGRVMQNASSLLITENNDTEQLIACSSDLDEAEPIYESLRSRMVEQINKNLKRD